MPLKVNGDGRGLAWVVIGGLLIHIGLLVYFANRNYDQINSNHSELVRMVKTLINR